MAGPKFCSKAIAFGSLILSSLLTTTLAADSTNTTTVPSSLYSSNGVKVAINVPDNSGSTDLYFKFEAPADHEWVGFGMGMIMDNSLMFVVYRSADDQGEPTVSTRVGEGHVMPKYYNGTMVNVLEGSEVTDDNFIVNIHCHNCRNWGEGNLDTSSTSARFFYALGPSGSAIMSDDVDAVISQHSSHPKQFNLDIKAATGINGVPVFATDDDGDGDADDSSDGPFGYTGTSRGIAFHAFVMTFAFTIVFPGGYLLLRLFERVWLHWSAQSFGVLLVVLGVGSGIAVSIKEDISPKLTHPHQIIGLLTFAIVIAAMVLGGIGHMSFKRRGVPSPLMKGHRIAGPLAITMGFVNACIGLAWAGRTKAIIGYVIFDLIVVLIIGGLVFLKRKRTMKRNAMNTTAAQNFRDTTTAYTHVRGGSQSQFARPPPAYNGYQDQAMPLEPMRQPGHSGGVEYYNVQPNK